MRRPQRGTLLKLALPEGARLLLRKRAGETTYLPLRDAMNYRGAATPSIADGRRADHRQ